MDAESLSDQLIQRRMESPQYMDLLPQSLHRPLPQTPRSPGGFDATSGDYVCGVSEPKTDCRTAGQCVVLTALRARVEALHTTGIVPVVMSLVHNSRRRCDVDHCGFGPPGRIDHPWIPIGPPHGEWWTATIEASGKREVIESSRTPGFPFLLHRSSQAILPIPREVDWLINPNVPSGSNSQEGSAPTPRADAPQCFHEIAHQNDVAVDVADNFLSSQSLGLCKQVRD